MTTDQTPLRMHRGGDVGLADEATGAHNRNEASRVREPHLHGRGGADEVRTAGCDDGHAPDVVPVARVVADGPDGGEQGEVYDGHHDVDGDLGVACPDVEEHGHPLA